MVKGWQPTAKLLTIMTMTNPKGAGAPRKYKEPTVTLAFRVPKSEKESIQKMIRELLKTMEV
jgi:hypothetical protein